MRLSTVNTIYWVSVAIFWALLIVDIITPGKAPLAMSIAQDLSLYALIAASSYALGVKSKASSGPTTINIYAESSK